MAQLPSNKCSYCENKIGNTYCYQCRFFLCEPCKLGHDKFPATKKHSVTDAKNVDRFTLNLNIDCDKHNMEFVNYCRTLYCLICSTCVTSDHNEHTFSGIVEKSLELRKRVDENIAALELRERSLLDLISQTQLLIDQIINERDRYLEDVIKTSKDIIAIVESVTTDTCDHVCKIYSEENEAIVHVMSQLQRAKEERSILCSKLKNVLKMKYDLEFLFHHKQITNDLEHLDDNIPGLFSRHTIDGFKKDDFADLIVQTIGQKYKLRYTVEIQSKVISIKSKLESMTKQKNQIEQCTQDEIRKLNEQLRILKQTNIEIQRCDGGTNSGHVETRHHNEQSALDKILQKTARNDIDVSVECNLVEQTEYQERARQYSNRINMVVVSSRLRQKTNLPNCLIAPQSVLAGKPISLNDVQLITNAAEKAAKCIKEIKVHHKENLVIPFGVP